MNALPSARCHCHPSIAALALALLLLAHHANAQMELFLQAGAGGAYEPNVNRTQDSTTDYFLTDSTAGPHESSTLDLHFGLAHVTGKTATPGGDDYYGASTNGYARWTDVLTINSPDPNQTTGTAHITMHLRGAMHITADGDAQASAQYGVYIYSGPAYNYFANYNGYLNSYNGLLGTDPATLGSFTIDVPFNFGSPFPMSYSLNCDNGGSDTSDLSGGSTTDLDFALSGGSITVTDDDQNPLEYTAETIGGTARGSNFAPGDSFSSFTLTNDAPNRMGSTMALLDGTASAPTQVAAAFVAPPADNTIKPVSDVVDLQGTNSDPVVIKVTFDKVLAQSAFGSLLYLELAWFDSHGVWKNAVLGNTGATVPTAFSRGYDPATDFHLGYFGIDMDAGYVWAVVNHNSQFVVTVPPPVLAINSATLTAPGTFHLACKGEPARANRIEASTDLHAWSTLATVTAGPDGAFTYDDTAATGPKKFYRVAYP